MPQSFDLTAKLNIVGPTNIKPVVQSLQSQLNGIKGNIQVQLSRNFVTSLTSANKQLQSFSRNLIVTASQAKNATQAYNQLSAAIKNISNAAQGIQSISKPIQNVTNTIRGVSHGIDEFGAKSALALRRNAAFLLPTTAIFAFVTATKKGISEALNFERELVRLSQITGKSLSGLSDIKDEVTRLSTSLGVSSKELITVSTTLAQAGFNAKDVQIILEGLAQSALAPTFDDIQQTTEGVIAAFNQFELKATDVQGVLGSLNAVAAAYAVESDDLITVIRRTGGAFKSSGGDLNELIALFTSVRQTTRESAETIATGFRTIFTRIQRPKTIEFLREMGIELTDLEGKFVGPFEAIKRLNEGLSRLDSRDLRFAGVIEELGGFRQVSKVIPLIQQFPVALQALGVAEQGTGSLARDAATAQQSLLVQIQKVKEEFNDLFRTIVGDNSFQALVKTVLELASSFATLAKSITPILPFLTLFGVSKLAVATPKFLRGFASGFASGGLVPGSGNRDTVPAVLTPGEFVVNKQTASRIGLSNLNKLNKVQGFASGGPVGPINVTQQIRLEGLLEERRLRQAERTARQQLHNEILRDLIDVKNESKVEVGANAGRTRSLLSRASRIGPLGVLGAGVVAQQFTNGNSSVGGAISGATGGAAIGSFFGPFGTVIGGAIGAMIGFTDAIKDQAANIAKSKLDEAVQNASKTLEQLGNARSVNAEQRQNISDQLQQSNVLASTQLGNIASPTNIVGIVTRDLKTVLKSANEGFSSFGGTDNSIRRNLGNELTRDSTSVLSNAAAQSEQNLGLLKSAILANIRGGKDIVNTPEFEQARLEAGFIELNRRFLGGSIQAGNESRIARTGLGKRAEDRTFEEISSILAVGAAGGQTIDAFVSSQKSIINLQNKLDSLAKVGSDNISVLQTMSGSISLATQDLDKLEQNFSIVNDTINGTVSSLKLLESATSVTFGGVGQTNRINQLGGFIGGGVGNNLAQRGLEIQQITSILPQLLEEAANKGVINKPGEEAIPNLVNRLGGGLLADIIARNIEKAGANGPNDIIELAKVDPKKAAEAAFGDTKGAIQEIFDTLNKSVTDGGNKLLNAFTNLAVVTEKVSALDDQRAKILQELNVNQIVEQGGLASLSDLLSSVAQEQQRLTRGTVVPGQEFNAGVVGQALGRGRNVERTLTEQIIQNPLKAIGLGDELAQIKQSNSNLATALNELVNPTKQLAAINTKLAEAESRRNSLASAAQQGLSGGFADRQKIARQAVFARLAEIGGPEAFKGLNARNQNEALQGFGILGRGDLQNQFSRLTKFGSLLELIGGNPTDEIRKLQGQRRNVNLNAVEATNQQQNLNLDQIKLLQEQTISASNEFAQKIQDAVQLANQSFNSLIQNSERLGAALANIPTQIEHTINGNLNVNITGLSALQQLTPHIQQLVHNEIRKTIDKENGPHPLGQLR